MKPPMWAGVALVLTAFGSSAADYASDEPYKEADAVRVFLAGSPQARLVPLQAEAAGAGLRIGSEVGNPAVAYQIEDTAGVRDEFLTFQQEIPITGRRSLLHDGADAAASAAGLAGTRGLQNAVASLRTAFHEVLYTDAAVEIFLRGGERQDRTVEILRLREREGEGSGYDVLRAEQEQAELRVELEKAKAASITARAFFGSFFDESLKMSSAAIEGDASPSEPPWSLEEAVELALTERADLMALRQDARHQEIGLRAAQRERFPEPVLTAGWKRVEALGESDTGFVASLMVPIPVFDRGRHEAARARAESGLVNEHLEILEREIRAEVASALASARAAWMAAEQFGSPVERRAGDLRRIAQLAYDEGEKGILDLLDAFRTSLRMELQALTVRHEAKKTQVELDRVMGVEVQP